MAGRTAADVRDTMIEGESGLLATAKPWNKCRYHPSKRRVVWQSGLTAICFSSERPAAARGPQYHMGWGDEVAAWQYQWEFWSNLMLGLRLGANPQWVATTTPRPTRLIRHLIAEHGKTVHVQHGSTYDNLQNLSPLFRKNVLSQYEGTRLGKQELLGEVLSDTPGQIFKLSMFETPGFRVGADQVPELVKVVVGVDPAASSGEDAANTGIIAAGLGADDAYYVLRDATLRDTPLQWGKAAVNAHNELEANYVAAETNNGGDMVVSNLRTVDPRVKVVAVHASRGKQTRAEPVASLYEQGRVHHVGFFDDLEDEMTQWVPGGKLPSPDRMDALVWAITALMGNGAVNDEVDASAVLGSSPLKSEPRESLMDEDDDYTEEDPW